MLIEIDDELGKAVEQIYEKKGLTFAEAVKIFAEKSIELGTSPFFIKNKRNSARGILSHYANPALIPSEENAWEKSVTQKYGENIN